MKKTTETQVKEITSAMLEYGCKTMSYVTYSFDKKVDGVIYEYFVFRNASSDTITTDISVVFVPLNELVYAVDEYPKDKTNEKTKNISLRTILLGAASIKFFRIKSIEFKPDQENTKEFAKRTIDESEFIIDSLGGIDALLKKFSESGEPPEAAVAIRIFKRDYEGARKEIERIRSEEGSLMRDFIFRADAFLSSIGK